MPVAGERCAPMMRVPLMLLSTASSTESGRDISAGQKGWSGAGANRPPSAFQAGHTPKSQRGMRACSAVADRGHLPLVAAVAVTVAVSSGAAAQASGTLTA
jgi:hypothetical protein